MKRSDRRRWAAAETLTDLGSLTALWLEGEIGQTPGYIGPPDDETKEITPTLVRLNRFGGIVTYGSQPGFDGIGYDGAHWRQRPAVELLAEPDIADRLAGNAFKGGFIVTHHVPPLPRIHEHYDDAVSVSGRRNESGEWETTCMFGAKLSRRTLREEFGYSEGALRAAYRAHQVTLAEITHAEWARPAGQEGDRLWRWLEEWLTSSTTSHLWS